MDLYDKSKREVSEIDKLPGDEFSITDQLSKKLMAICKEKNLGQVIQEDWSSMCNDRAEWLNRQSTYLQNWDEFLEIAPQGIFESSSNVHVPATFWVVKAYHARFMQALYNPDLQVSLSAKKEAYRKAADSLTNIVKYTTTEWANRNKGVFDEIDQAVWIWITRGVGILKWRWECDYEKFIDLEDQIKFMDYNEYVLDDKTGQQLALPKYKTSKKEVEQLIKVFDGPICDCIDVEDIGVSNNNYADLESADKVIHRTYYTASDLWVKADKGIFDYNAVKEVVDSGRDNVSGALGSTFKFDKFNSSANARMDKNYENDRYEILEAYYRTPIDDTGINSNIVVWVHAGTGKVLRATFLRRINRRSNKRPFASFVFHRKSGTNETFPVGLPEILHSIQKELNAIHNMRIDFGLLGSMPFGFYRSGSSLDSKELRIEPGTFIPVDNPQTDVYIPNISNNTGFLMNEELNLYNMIERITSINDVALGSMGGGVQGVTRTAYGTQSLQREMNTNLDIPYKRLTRGLGIWLEYLVHMLQQRLPQGFEYKITNDEGLTQYLKVNTIEDILGDFDFTCSTSSSDSNKAVQMETAAAMLQLTQNPLDIQLGIVTPANRYEAIKNYMKVLGVKSVNKFINGQFENQITLTPEEEIQRTLAGLEVTVLPNSDHEGVINYANDLIKDGVENKKINPRQVLLLKGLVNKHEAMMQALEQIQAQQQVYNQMITNQQAGAGAGSQNIGPETAQPEAGLQGLQ